MPDDFVRLRTRILRALDAASTVGADDALLLRVLAVGSRPPAMRHLAGALTYLSRARLVTRERAGDDAFSVSRLTNKGARFLSYATTGRGRRLPPPPTSAAPTG